MFDEDGMVGTMDPACHKRSLVVSYDELTAEPFDMTVTNLMPSEKTRSNVARSCCSNWCEDAWNGKTQSM